MSMYEQARSCGVDPDAMFDREYEDGHRQWRYECNTCGGVEVLSGYRANYVCPWCGDGVMELEGS
jgi:ribosomal protein S27AE